MKRIAWIAALAFTPAWVSAQQIGSPSPQGESVVVRRNFSGPRFGVTAFTGDVAELREGAGQQPYMTQFGWQWETALTQTDVGDQLLLEWVILVGGVEQSEFNTSLTWVAGYRLANGIEFGVGPSVTLPDDSEEVTTSMIVAGGIAPSMGSFRLPMNVAVALAEGGPRITALVGWIAG